MQAIGRVIINRERVGGGGNIRSVLMAPNQFGTSLSPAARIPKNEGYYYILNIALSGSMKNQEIYGEFLDTIKKISNDVLDGSTVSPFGSEPFSFWTTGVKGSPFDPNGTNTPELVAKANARRIGSLGGNTFYSK